MVTVVDVGGHTVQVNQPLTVTISVSNEGGASGTFETAASFGELAADAKSVVIEPDATETLTFTFQPESFGRQAIEIEAIPDMQAAVSVVPVPRGPDELDAVRSVGAHYYPWYGAPAHDWRDGNWSLESPSTSVLGDYTSSRDYVIDWCHTAGIDWLSVAW